MNATVFELLICCGVLAALLATCLDAAYSHPIDEHPWLASPPKPRFAASDFLCDFLCGFLGGHGPHGAFTSFLLGPGN